MTLVERAFDSIERFGLVRKKLYIGYISIVDAQSIQITLATEKTQNSGVYHGGSRYGKGEVGEFIVIESQQSLLFGRITEVRLPDKERKDFTDRTNKSPNLDTIAFAQLLGTIPLDRLSIMQGVSAYPRIGDSVYSAPTELVSLIPILHNKNFDEPQGSTINIGHTSSAKEGQVSVKPEALFGRHCAILGSTGGGKSWTTAHLVEETLKLNSKVILIDPTSEYRNFQSDHVVHLHFGQPVYTAHQSFPSCLPPSNFEESDFIALFDPAGKVQGPKLRAAIKSLRLAAAAPQIAPDGFIRKIDQPKEQYLRLLADPYYAQLVDDPKQPFDFRQLTHQIEQECVWPEAFVRGGRPGQKDPTKWGGESGEFTNCLPLVTRIEGILASDAFSCVFRDQNNPIDGIIDRFFDDPQKKLLRLCMSGVSYEYDARLVLTNALGRLLLNKARQGRFRSKPLLVVLDEAHHFIGKQIGTEDGNIKLNSFDLIAKEGRKYGLNICLATQRPRDLTEGVLSQMGALIVHRLTNDRDRLLIERACGEMDRSAMAFIPSLQPGEAALIGIDFPIPMTVQVKAPFFRPESDGPDYQNNW
ncbi:cell division protein FtsK [Marinobacter sp. B9-2]|nr:cell division protein FtsK [Marinobacter sp. B9-2]